MATTEDLAVLQVTTTERSFFSQQVAELESRGVSCTTLSVPGDPGSGRSPADYARFYARLLAAAREDYDVVHANYGLVGPLALAQPTRPVVLTLWGSELLGDAGRLERWSRLAARRADAVVAPSPAISRALSVPHRTIPFGVDTDRFRPIDRERARERVGWDDGPNVLFPYDPDRRVKNYPLARRVVDRLSVDARLRTVSGEPHGEIPHYMNAADAVLVTSRYESGPMVVKEAAACNVPVVATPVGFVPDVLTDVDHSHVARDEEALVEALAAVLGSGGRSDGRRVIDDLGVEAMGDSLVELYEQVTTA